VIVPVRGVVEVLAVREKLTVPLPDPLADVRVIKDGLFEEAVHEQPA
jgi:hypothetical protein